MPFNFLREIFGGDDDDKPGASSGNKTYGGGSVVDNIVEDISIGMATFGQSYDEMFDTMTEELGYAPNEAADYIEKTQATQAAQQAAMQNNDDDDDRPAPAPVEEEEEEVAEVVEEPTPVEEQTQQIDELSEEIFGADGEGGGAMLDEAAVALDTDPDRDSQVTVSTGSAAGGTAEKEAAEPKSVGKAEDDAIQYYEKGRRATIKTTPQGLLTEEDDESLRPRRSLMG